MERCSGQTPRKDHRDMVCRYGIHHYINRTYQGNLMGGIMVLEFMVSDLILGIAIAAMGLTVMGLLIAVVYSMKNFEFKEQEPFDITK